MQACHFIEQTAAFSLAAVSPGLSPVCSCSNAQWWESEFIYERTKLGLSKRENTAGLAFVQCDDQEPGDELSSYII